LQPPVPRGTSLAGKEPAMFKHRLRTILLLIVACAISLSTVSRKTPSRQGETSRGQTIVGRVIKIADGDTLTILDADNVQHRIRLFGIDAPEKSQPFGNQSKKSLSEKVFGETVRIEVTDIDRYGRAVGRIFLGNRFINLEQVRDGFAWRYTAYDRHHEFEAAEAEARAHRRGLWSAAHPTPPWEFRHAQQSERNSRI
jgi:endonuclease YncB( thermonuclease family)